MYLTQFVYGAIEVPSKLMVYYLLEKIGRRKTEAGAQLLAGISLMMNIFIPKGETRKTNIWLCNNYDYMYKSNVLNILEMQNDYLYIADW